MTRSSPVGSSFHRPSPGCLQPHRSYHISSPHLPISPQQLAQPSQSSFLNRPPLYPLRQPTRPGVVPRQPLCWWRHPSTPGPASRLGRALAYLLAEEEALGGEHSEAVGGRALCRAVGAGSLADFSLLLLTQIEESV